MGSKRRIAKDILPIILKNRKNNQWYVEPFVGGCNVIDKVLGNRMAGDFNEYIYAMWNALVNGNWIPPSEITEEQYNDINNNKDKYPKELVGFVGIAATFGSKWFGGYARNKRGINYAMEGRAGLLKQIELLRGTMFYFCSYDKLPIPPESIIYCDPPYEGTVGYKDKFNHIDFWQWCRNMNDQGHEIYISEYNAPSDFKCIWERELKTNMDAKCNIKSTEKLFTLNNFECFHNKKVLIDSTQSIFNFNLQHK